jgi:hypothetical protein
LTGSKRIDRIKARAPPKKPQEPTNHPQKTNASCENQKAQANASWEQTQYDNPAHEHKQTKRNLPNITKPSHAFSHYENEKQEKYRPYHDN